MISGIQSKNIKYIKQRNMTQKMSKWINQNQPRNDNIVRIKDKNIKTDNTYSHGKEEIWKIYKGPKLIS